MAISNFKQKSVNVHDFSMIPRSDVPRSRFKIQHSYKTTFNADGLYPIFVEEVLPGDHFTLNMTAFARMATPLYPIMDNLHFESFFFFVPYRLVWDHWVNFMGEQDKTTGSTDFTVPQIVSYTGGWNPLSIYDYLGLPVKGQVLEGNTVSHSVLPLRAYNLIWWEWFRDENIFQTLPSGFILETGDGPDPNMSAGLPSYRIMPRGKRHDYFTSVLPWPQKGDAVTIGLTGTAPIIGNLTASGPMQFSFPVVNAAHVNNNYIGRDSINGVSTLINTNVTDGASYVGGLSVSGLSANLADVAAVTVNQLRMSFQIQKLLERDARGGTRYTEVLRAHFGVYPQDARLQRPEYLGGGSSPINVNPIAQTSGSGATGTNSPLGQLGAMATMLARNHGFSKGFVEHGVVIGLINVRADLAYQQGMARMWSRKTRYDFYFPVFSHLGEQAVLSKELYCDGSADDENVFGYQERWAEYRYKPSIVTGQFRSSYPQTLDGWHLAQYFTSRPVLNYQFINSITPMDRILAVQDVAGGQEFYLDAFFDITAVRPLPMYSVPGLIDHF